MTADIETVVVVPCYNEARRLDFAAFGRFLRGHAGVAFCFVDDGSGDGTDRLLARFAAEWPARVAVETLARNRGKGEAVRRGVLAARTRWPEAAFCGFWDADLATPLEEIPEFVRRLRAARGVAALGSRVDTGIRRPLGRRLPSLAVRAVLSVVARLPWRDTQCGAKLFCAPLAAGIFRRPFRTRWLFDVELLARIPRAFRADVLEIPLPCWRDRDGSKLRARDVPRILRELCVLLFTFSFPPPRPVPRTVSHEHNII